MNSSPYTPTRACPHRLCKPLHLVPLPFMLAIFAFDLWHNWVFLVTFLFGVFLAAWLPRVIHFKRRHRAGPVTVKDVVQDLKDSPTEFDLAMQDSRYEGTGWRVLEVRRGWAVAAVTCDAILVFIVGATSVQVFRDLDEASRVAESAGLDAAMALGLVITVVFFGFSMYAHKKATQPRKPKRAWLPAFLRTNT